ncbi:MAG: glycosyltransferase [Nitrospira sp.]|nr:glycosyltransferase [Nitrospira sp.]
MRISIIIPAFNEERLIGRCVESVFASLADHTKPGLTAEVIVVDNNSTDRTGQLAQQAGARVVFEPINQIGRARNTGAAAATGNWLLFLDADSLLSPELLSDILAMIEAGKHVGCGSTLAMEGLPWWANGIFHLWRGMSVLFGWAAGALIVCRHDAFREVGGFPQDLYALEEIHLSKRLKAWGRQRDLRFIILSKHPLETSSRKVTLYSPGEIASQILRVFLQRRRTLRDKTLLSVWYDGRR